MRVKSRPSVSVERALNAARTEGFLSLVFLSSFLFVFLSSCPLVFLFSCLVLYSLCFSTSQSAKSASQTASPVQSSPVHFPHNDQPLPIFRPPTVWNLCGRSVSQCSISVQPEQVRHPVTPQHIPFNCHVVPA